jgi:hypothetical protein
MSQRLNRIPALHPVLIPAKDELNATDFTIVGLEISEPDDTGDQQLIMQFRPYNYDLNKFHETNELDSKLVFSVYNLASEYPRIFAALNEIIDICGFLKKKNDLEYDISLLEDGSEKTELQNDLAEVKTDLGAI